MKHGKRKNSSINLFELKVVLFFFLLLSVGLNSAAQEKDLPELVQITTHPGRNFQPAVSPDGKWLAFVSIRSNNKDIWIKRLPHGTSYRITQHRADDFLPSWSFDGKKIVFVSRRQDAFGDIWVADISFSGDKAKLKKLRQITKQKSEDISPCFSPDDRFIAFTSNRDGKNNIWIYDFKGDTVSQVTVKGGFEPDWSSKPFNYILFTSTRKNRDGDIFFIKPEMPETLGGKVVNITDGQDIDGSGKWSPSCRQIVFVRRNRISSKENDSIRFNNSRLFVKSVNPDSLYDLKKQQLSSPEIELTSSLSNSSHPSWDGKDRICFCSEIRGKVDIWSIPSEGIVPRAQDSRTEYERILERFGSAVSARSLSYVLIALKSLVRRFPSDSLIVSRSLIQQGEIYLSLKDSVMASRSFKRAYHISPVKSEEKARAFLKWSFYSDLPKREKINACEKMSREFSNILRVKAEALIQKGDLLVSVTDYGRALEAYTNVLSLFPDKGNVRAQALLKIGDIFSYQDQQNMADKEYLTVLLEYSSVPLWRKRAGERLLGAVSGTLKERVTRLRQIIKDTKNVQSLQAQAHLMICKTFLDSLHYREAEEELKSTDRLFPDLMWAGARADIMLASAYESEGDELKAIFILEDIEKEYRDTEAGRFAAQAIEMRFNLLKRTAERLINSGDFALAEARFRQAVKLHPENFKAQRGLVKAAFYNRTLDNLIDEYREKIKQPCTASTLYGYGLALSFKGEQDKKSLVKSNLMLNRSLEEDYQQPYPYLTLSYNYELIEDYLVREKQKKRNFVQKIGRMLYSPITSVARIFSGSRKKEHNYYEQAIQALLTGIEVNDEKINFQLEVMLIQNLANNFYKLGQYGYSKAFHFYQKRLSIDTTFTTDIEKAVFYKRAGHCGVFLQDTATVNYLTTAVDLFRKMNNTEEELRSLNLIAFYYYMTGRYEDSLQFYHQIGMRYQRMGRYKDAELAFRNLAYNYYLLEEPREVVTNSKIAEEMLDHLKNDKEQKPDTYLRIEFLGLSIPIWKVSTMGSGLSEGFSYSQEAALIYGLISRSSEDIGVLHESIDYELKRLGLFIKEKDKLAERVCLNRIGVLFLKQGNDEKAWEYILKSYKKSLKAKDKPGISLTSLNLGYAALKELSSKWDTIKGDFVKQILADELDKNLEMNRKSQIEILNILGGIEAAQANNLKTGKKILNMQVKESFIRLVKLNSSVRYFLKAMDIAEKQKDFYLQGVINKNLAEVYAMSGEYGNALKCAVKAEKFIRKSGDLRSLWRIIYAKVRFMSMLTDRKNYDFSGQLTKAVDYCIKTPPDQTEPFSFIPIKKEQRKLFEDAARSYFSKGDIIKSVEILEAGKEKEVSEIVSIVEPEFKKERHEIIWKNYFYSKKEMYLKLKLAGEGIKRKRKKQSAVQDFEKYQNMIQQEDDVLAYLAGAYRFSLYGFQKILSADEAAVLYIPGMDSTIVIAVMQDTILYGKIPQTYTEIKSRTSVFNKSFYNNTPDQNQGEKLFDMLLGPVREVIDAKNSFIFVQSDFTNNLPFEALCNQDGYLGLHKKIRYCPGLSYELISSTRPRINQKSILFITEGGSSAGGKEFTGFNKDILSGKDATYTGVKQKLSASDVVVFSRRMLFRSSDPFGSIMFLAPDTSSDGLVSLRDFFPLDIKASIAVLNARKKINDENAAVFASTLLYGGVPSIIWVRKPVPVDVENRFFSTFFKNISFMSAQEAFNEARFQTEKDTSLYWACFGFMGFKGFTTEQKREFALKNINRRISKALYFFKTKDYKTSKDYLEEALSMAVATGDTAKEHSIYRRLVSVCIKGGFWEKVTYYQKKLIGALSFKLGKHYKLEMSRFVSILVKAKKFKQAANVQKNVIAKMQSGIKQEQAILYLAFLYSRARMYKESVTWADSAKNMAVQRGDREDQAKALLFKGKFLVEDDSSFAALVSLKEGIALLESEKNVVSDILKNIASGYQLLGIANEKLGRYNAAFKSQQKGLEIFNQLNLKFQHLQGIQYMANLLWKMGRYKDALEYQNRALKELAKFKDTNLLAAAYSTRGLIDMDLGNENGAMAWLEKALSISERSKNNLNSATILKNMGLVAIRKKEFDRAMEFFRRAMESDSTSGYKRGFAYDKVDLGLLLIEKDDFTTAKNLLQSGLDLSRKIGDKRNEVKAMLALGRVFHLLKNNDLSLALLDTAYKEAENLGTPTFLWRIARQRGLVLKESGRKIEALKELKEAVGIVERIRRDLKVEELKQGFFGTKMDLYSDIVTLLLEMGRDGEAFSYAERAQSRSFIDMLANKEIDLSTDKKNIVNKINSVRQKVEELADSIKVVQLNYAEDEDQLTELKNKLELARREYNIRVSFIKNNYPEIASLITVDPITITEVQSMLPDSIGIVKYFVTAKSVIIWFISDKKVYVKEKMIPAKQLQAIVYRFRENIQAYLSVGDLAKALYAILIKPVEGDVFSKKYIIISPHSVLHYLPFAALKASDDSYLIDKVSISNIPSVSVLRFCFHNTKQINQQKKVFAVGNPAVKGKESLVFADKEIRSIKRSFPNCKIFSGENATEKVVRDNVSFYDILHFACHAVYNEKAPLKSALFLAPDKKNDGLLEAKEIFGIEINAGLVTLSGCETGMSKVSPGDEIIGFTRSFIFAGTSSIVSSLWKVNDLETAVLVKRFYRALSNGQSKADALRSAQLIVKNMVNSHPSAWAGFTLTGNYQ